MNPTLPADFVQYLKTRELPKRLLRVGLALTSTFYSLRPDSLLAKSAPRAGTPERDWPIEGGLTSLTLPERPTPSRGELFFIDAGVADPGAFWLAAPKGGTVVCIPAGVDSWRFMAQEAARFQGLGAIHIVSHGKSGALVLNGQHYAAADLETLTVPLQQLGHALTKNGDIFLYGCEVGAGVAGQNLLNTMAAATGADIAASKDNTGNADHGGNWDLEIVTGQIDSSLALNATSMAGYDAVLATYTVTNTSNSGTGSLRQAITDANATAENDIINFSFGAGSSPYTIVLATALPSIAAANSAGTLAIKGLGASSLIISGDNGDANRDFNLINISYGGNLGISGVTISGARTSANNGGGISNGGTLILSNSNISNNSGFYGGGVFNNGIAHVSNSTISGNYGFYGGGISNQGTLTISNSTIASNSARFGAGAYNQSSLTVKNCTISGNSAQSGGGIYNVSNISNSIIANNPGGDLAGSVGTNSNNLTGSVSIGSLQNNGGPTSTMAIAVGSSANGSGNASESNPAPVFGLDQRGYTRSSTAPSIGAYEYNGTIPPAPTVTSVSPSAGSLAGGNSITITGTNLAGATSVTIGGAPVDFNVASATSITATTPAGNVGSASVIVTTIGGSNVTNTLFTYSAGPTVTSISPTSGSTAGGTAITITGTNFTGATGVTIGSFAATGYIVNSATSITATTPAGSTGSSSVLVTTSGGTNAANTLFTYLGAANTPTFGTPTATAGGFTVQISNYDNNFTYSGTATAGGTVSISNLGLVTVSGVAANTSSTATVTTTRTNYASGSAPVTETSLAAPGAPTAVSAASGNSQATVTFSAPANNGGAAITSYTVTSSPGGFTGTGASSPITVTGLTNGTAYTFTVTATNVAGTSTASSSSNAVTPAIVPIIVTTTADSGPGSLRQAITDANASAVDDIINFNFATGTAPYTITLASALPSIAATGTAGTLTITGLGATSLTISGDNGNPSRDFSIFTILSGGNLSISGVTVSGVQSSGDGAFSNAGTLSVTHSTVSLNSAGFAGGGIRNYFGNVTVSNSTISENTALYSAGISATGGTVSVNNSTLVGNYATNLGGGIGVFNGSTVTLTHCTLSGNSASSGGGIYLDGGNTLNIANTIIANSTSGGDFVSSGTVNVTAPATAAHNLVSQGTFAWATTKTSAEINLSTLANNGGATSTLALLSGSVAIGTGNATVSNASPINGLDQRGTTRSPTAPSIGAYEGQNPANTPTFGSPTSTANGFTVQISNYDGAFTYGGTATASGTVAISGTGLVTVSGVAANTSSTATITTTRAAYVSGSAQVTATSATTPTVTSPTSASIGTTSATLGGNVTATGGASLTAVGVVYAITSTNSNPRLSGTGVTNVTGSAATGVFTVNATGLTAGTAYSYAAYATNSQGTTYTSVGTFTTTVPTPTLTFTTPTAASVAVGATRTNAATSTLAGGSYGAISYTSSDPSKATVHATTGVVTGVAVGTTTITVTQAAASGYNATASNTYTLTVTIGTPTITAAPTAAGITYGQTLASSTLSGGTASVAGTFAFTTPSTSPSVGTVAQGVTFTPTDTTNYTSTTTTANVTVAKATPTLTWATPSSITYGTALSATQLNATSSLAAGTITYSPASGTTPSAGTQTLTATFTPTDTANYNTATRTVSLVVGKATPTLTWATPSSITYGTALSATQLNATSSLAAGTITYSPASGTTPSAGTQTLTATFTPTDTANYNTATRTVSLVVAKATPTLTWATPSAITYGTALSATQLNATSSLAAGTITYSPASGTTPSAGTQTLTATFTPTDTANYNTATGTVSLVVNKATPTLTWASPSTITYGTALSATQLNATASVAGSFAYSPASGAIPSVGTQTLSATFTPTDTTNYNSASAAVSLNVIVAVPGAPTAISATTANGEATLTFTAPSYTGSSAITGYTIRATATDGSTVTVNAAGSPAKVTGLTPGKSYRFTITANNSAGSSDTSTTTDALTISLVNQTITFGPLANRTSNSGSFALTASASSGLSVTLTVVSGPALLSGNMLDLTGATGTVKLRASQAGNATYAAAPDVEVSFVVTAGATQAIFTKAIAPTTNAVVADVAVVLPANTRAGTLLMVSSSTPSLNGPVDFQIGVGGGFTAIIQSTSAIGFVPASGQTMLGAPVTYTITGSLTDNVLSGTIAPLGLVFSSTVPTTTPGATSAVGFYKSTALVEGTGATYSVVGANNEVLVLTQGPTVTTGGLTTLKSDNTFALTASGNVTLNGGINPATTTATATVTLPGNTKVEFAGLSTTTQRTDRLINLSSRAKVGTGESVLITGFVIGGTQSKKVLIRAVGPALSAFGLASPLPNPAIKIYQGTNLIAQNDDWNKDDAAEIARLGAFAFTVGSKDAALLTTLAPGAYTAQISDPSGTGTGVALAEIYDASINPNADYQRLVNISSRGRVTPDDGVLIGGFVVTGNAPKTLLIRGVGPALTSFGLAGALADPALTIYQDGKALATNEGWANNAAITTAAIQTGAFTLPSGSKDAAVLITLNPGAYTAQIKSAKNASSGVALIEIYEVP